MGVTWAFHPISQPLCFGPASAKTFGPRRRNAPGGRNHLRTDTDGAVARTALRYYPDSAPTRVLGGKHLRRLLPSARRLLTIGGATFVGLAATALFAAPASAHTADTKASACKTTT